MPKSALLIVDMLNDFVRKDGALYVPGAENIVENIGKIKGTAGETNVLVVYANDSHAEDDPEFKAWPKHCVKGSYGSEIYEQLKPANRDAVIEKQTLSAFSDSDLERLLKENGVNSLIIAGVATDYCVRAAALDAANLGYDVSVVVDAIAGVDLQKGDQHKALVEMGNSGVKPVYTKQFLEGLL